MFVIMILGMLTSNVNTHVSFDKNGDMVVKYSGPKSRKARNTWDKLNLNPNGVEIAIQSKRL